MDEESKKKIENALNFLEYFKKRYTLPPKKNRRKAY